MVKFCLLRSFTYMCAEEHVVLDPVRLLSISLYYSFWFCSLFILYARGSLPRVACAPAGSAASRADLPAECSFLAFVRSAVGSAPTRRARIGQVFSAWSKTMRVC